MGHFIADLRASLVQATTRLLRADLVRLCVADQCRTVRGPLALIERLTRCTRLRGALWRSPGTTESFSTAARIWPRSTRLQPLAFDPRLRILERGHAVDMGVIKRNVRGSGGCMMP
jgi:hypothetical protein